MTGRPLVRPQILFARRSFDGAPTYTPNAFVARPYAAIDDVDKAVKQEPEELKALSELRKAVAAVELPKEDDDD
jgi:hypothetical protein